MKYPDDTVVLGLINNDVKDEYRRTVSYVSEWLLDNYLDVNVTKTKEMVLDNHKVEMLKIQSLSTTSLLPV